MRQFSSIDAAAAGDAASDAASDAAAAATYEHTEKQQRKLSRFVASQTLSSQQSINALSLLPKRQVRVKIWQKQKQFIICIVYPITGFKLRPFVFAEYSITGFNIRMVMHTQIFINFQRYCGFQAAVIFTAYTAI